MLAWYGLAVALSSIANHSRLGVVFVRTWRRRYRTPPYTGNLSAVLRLLQCLASAHASWGERAVIERRNEAERRLGIMRMVLVITTYNFSGIILFIQFLCAVLSLSVRGSPRTLVSRASI